MQTADQAQNTDRAQAADCRPQTRYKTQTENKDCLFVKYLITCHFITYLVSCNRSSVVTFDKKFGLFLHVCCF